MARGINVTLDWQGPATDPAAFEGEAGIYLVLSAEKGSSGNYAVNSYVLLDIGQTGNEEERLTWHERRKKCWEELNLPGYDIVFKFAAMPSSKYDKTDRRIVECCLRAHEDPPCGTECNEGYNSEDSVSIKNIGQLPPLKPRYSCEGVGQ